MEAIEWTSGHHLYLLPVIRGLESERIKVREAFHECSPRVVAISISREELDGLRTFKGKSALPANFEEAVYMEKLSAFGKVSKPPPCFLEARDLTMENGLKLEPLDLDNEAFTEAYVTNISTIEMMTQSRIEGKLRGSRTAAETPEEFVLKFDKVVNSKYGFKKLEQARELHMAERLAELASNSDSVLALVEFERVEGVRQELHAYLPR